MEDSISIATFFMYKCFREGTSIDRIKIMKLSVIAHGYYLSMHGVSLLSGGVQTSPYGLIVMKQLMYFQGYLPYIPESLLTNSSLQQIIPDKHDKLNVMSFLGYIWESYGCYKPHHLSAMLNLPTQPWYDISKQSKDLFLEVPDTLFLEYFKDKKSVLVR